MIPTAIPIGDAEFVEAVFDPPEVMLPAPFVLVGVAPDPGDPAAAPVLDVVVVGTVPSISPMVMAGLVTTLCAGVLRFTSQYELHKDRADA